MLKGELLEQLALSRRAFLLQEKLLERLFMKKGLSGSFCSVLFFSRPRSEGWPHHGRTFSIYPCPLSF